MPIPEGPSKARDSYILNAVREGRAEFRFASVVYLVNGAKVEIEVFEDALKVDGVRVNVSAMLEQQIADLLGCSLLTPMIADILWTQRTWTCSPKIFAADASMASTARMIEHSQKIDQELASQDYSGVGIVQTNGKHWVLGATIRSNKARNYGWHFQASSKAYAPATSWAGPGVRVWQPPGLAHDPYHVDYSQVAVLVRRRVLVDGVEHDLSQMLSDINLRVFVSTEPNVSPRQPGVPQQPTLLGYELDRVFVPKTPSHPSSNLDGQIDHARQVLVLPEEPPQAMHPERKEKTTSLVEPRREANHFPSPSFLRETPTEDGPIEPVTSDVLPSSPIHSPSTAENAIDSPSTHDATQAYDLAAKFQSPPSSSPVPQVRRYLALAFLLVATVIYAMLQKMGCSIIQGPT